MAVEVLVVPGIGALVKFKVRAEAAAMDIVEEVDLVLVAKVAVVQVEIVPADAARRTAEGGNAMRPVDTVELLVEIVDVVPLVEAEDVVLLVAVEV